MSLVVFSDLDGTLLDHDTYEWAAARETVERLRTRGWPLVFVTSKTRAEVEVLRREMSADDPFIVENGAAAFFPERYGDVSLPGAVRFGSFRMLLFGRPYGEVRAFATSVAARYGLRGFGDMSVDRVADVTGLSRAQAARAKQREFTEPFVLDRDDALDALRDEATAAGFGVTTGGRLHHLIGSGQDKGRAVRAVHSAFEAAYGEAVTTVGLGDGPNDVPMLEAVDYPVLVPAPGRPLPACEHERTRVAPAEGPRGWSAAVERLIDELGSADAG